MESELSSEQRSLRVVLPDFYNFITNELEKLHNIHPYDIQLYTIEKETGHQLLFYFGEGYSHQKSHFFSQSSVENMGDDVTEFIEEFGESCKEVMIADYFKMMKP